MPTNQQIADSIEALSQKQIAYANNSRDTPVYETSYSHLIQADADDADEAFDDLDALNSTDFEAVQALLTDNYRLADRPC